MTATYDCIATTTLTTSQSSIEFASISGAYTDLVLACAAKASASNDIYIRANNDTGANYAYTTLFAYPTVIGGAKGADVANGLLTDYYGTPKADFKHICIANFPNYANTNTFKIMLSRANSCSDGNNTGVDLNISLWRSTSAITSLLLRLPGANFAVGTKATLYGIKCE